MYQSETIILDSCVSNCHCLRQDAFVLLDGHEAWKQHQETPSGCANPILHHAFLFSTCCMKSLNKHRLVLISDASLLTSGLKPQVDRHGLNKVNLKLNDYSYKELYRIRDLMSHDVN